MLENVRVFLILFDEYRRAIKESLEVLGYRVEWRLLNV